MKFSEFFLAPGLRRLSVWIGVMTGLIISMFLGWKWGVLCGAVAVLILSLLLPVVFYLKFLPYARIKKSIKQPFLFDEPVRFAVKTGTVGGFFILTEKSMIFVSLECDTQKMELLREEIKSVRCFEHYNLDIYLNNTQFIRVFSGVREELVKILREHGWSITE